MGKSDQTKSEDTVTEWQKRLTGSDPLCLRVDLLGPPAAGKSTLCQAVFKKLQTAEKIHWINLKQAKQLATRNALLNAIPKQRMRDRILELSHALLNAFGFARNKVDTPSFVPRSLFSLQEQLMNLFSSTNHSFLAALAEQWHDPDTSFPPKFERYNQVRNWIKDLLFTVSFVENQKVLADNARLTKGMAELLSNTLFPNSKDLVTQYCRSPLAPTGIIHLSVDPTVVTQRSKQRHKDSGRLNPGHTSRSEAEIRKYTERKNEVNTHAVSFFEKKGISVLNLSAETDIQANTDQVISFLRNLKLNSLTRNHN